MKHLPREMREWYFPFNWDVNEVWKLEGQIEKRKIEDLMWHLEKPFWSSVQGKGMMFDLKPREVLEEPEKYLYHSARIKKVDISYPVCLTLYKEREIIVDGIHRLAKLASENIETIEVKVIDGRSIASIGKYV